MNRKVNPTCQTHLPQIEPDRALWMVFLMSMMEELLRKKLTDEEYQLALQLLKLPPSRIRTFLEEKAEEATK